MAVDGWVFEVGGKSEVYTGSGSTATFGAALGPDGQLGTWSALTALPVGRTNHALAVGGDFLYLTGGATSGPGDDQVFAARVRY